MYIRFITTEVIINMTRERFTYYRCLNTINMLFEQLRPFDVELTFNETNFTYEYSLTIKSSGERTNNSIGT